MERKSIETKNAPPAIGPYSQAVLAGDTLYISGQICMDPQTGELNNSDVEEETHQCMANLKAILQAAGLDFSNVVKSIIFITDMNQFGKMNTVYSEYFEAPFPARETVQVAALPRFVNVEISMIAVR